MISWQKEMRKPILLKSKFLFQGKGQYDDDIMISVDPEESDFFIGSLNPALLVDHPHS